MQLSSAATAITAGNDGSAAFLDRYRAAGGAHNNAGAGYGGGNARGMPVQQGGPRAALTDKYGNLI